ncbi:MAG TPA: MFS transporter [Hyphomicrobiaceae bacterium]|jgi:MFS family permease|nr:MFS transporter [Hyphomicrobiaceae bacterium]
MHSRWAVLALLFTVRATMAFQFQSVAAVSPLLQHDLGVNIADIGTLIGLYFAPGIVLALPGGALGKRFGDKAVVLIGLGLMLAGGLLMAAAGWWDAQIAGRLISGTGGVLLNVVMTKMVADWFAGREISTAMAIFVNSWPFGIAISLLLLPVIGVSGGVAMVHLFVAGLVGAGLLLLAAAYRAPAAALQSAAASRLGGRAAVSVVTAGLIWGFYNVAFAMIFSFGPLMLAERGWSVTAAGSAISVVLWLTSASVPLGGFLADRSGRNDAVLVGGCVAFALLMILATRIPLVVPAMVALGLVCGLAAGPIMALPARVLEPGTRAIGMGIFYFVFYASMMLGPPLGGRVAMWAGTPRSAFDFGAGMLAICVVLVGLFRRRQPAAAAAPVTP